MEKDKRVGPERQRRNAIAAVAAVDGSLNILGIVGESDRVHNGHGCTRVHPPASRDPRVQDY